MKYKIFSVAIICIVYAVSFTSCRSTKFVPDGEYLLASAEIRSDTKAISAWESQTYINQKPNFKTFELFKLPLTIYNLSGTDTTKWVNRVLRNAGEPPIIYDSTKVDKTVVDLQRMMTNKGFLDAEVDPDIRLTKKKAKITYNIISNEPYVVSSYEINIPDTIISRNFLPAFSSRGQNTTAQPPSFNLDSALYRNSLIKKDMNFDLDVLDLERDRIAAQFRRTGYYSFNKEYIGFVADTAVGQHLVDLELTIYPFTQRTLSGAVTTVAHPQYTVEEVNMYIDFNPLVDGDISRYQVSSVFEQEGYRIIYGPRGRYIRPQVLLDNCFIRPGMLFNENMTTMTYAALSQLTILKNVNISFEELTDNKLRCVITCVPDKRQGFSAEIEGTNSGGLFGVGGSLGYLHRNVLKGSEQFNIKAFAAYEAITPSFTTFRDNYFEVGGETSLTFPRFMAPFLNKDFKRRIHASTQFSTDYTFQRRPGYFTRTILSSGMKYIWQGRGRATSVRHTLDLIDIGYIHLSNLNQDFEDKLSEPARRYSFTDQFIMSTGYTYFKTNANPTSTTNRSMKSIYNFRASVESAGNLLSLVASIANAEKDSLGSRRVFNTSFAQYVRGTVDYSKTIRIDEKNSVAWRLGGGIAYPYGNFKQIPIQKRYFSGGANSVRGWAIRELGPGNYYGPNATFYNHSGEIRFDAGAEYRSKIFWILELGAFIDAGNIWTVHAYEDQEGGNFQLNRFYKEIALSWGLGIRLDFDFILVRLDCGWKAYDPADNPNETKWPIKYPFKFGDNTAWHIAVGYPF